MDGGCFAESIHNQGAQHLHLLHPRRLYDFDLKFAQDESQYGGEVRKADDTQSPPLFTAVQEQLGLKLTATRGTVSTLLIDSVQKPSAD